MNAAPLISVDSDITLIFESSPSNLSAYNNKPSVPASKIDANSTPAAAVKVYKPKPKNEDISTPAPGALISNTPVANSRNLASSPATLEQGQYTHQEVY